MTNSTKWSVVSFAVCRHGQCFSTSAREVQLWGEERDRVGENPKDTSIFPKIVHSESVFRLYVHN